MHLYSANITSSFLEKLNNPTIPPRNPSSLSIQITTIPYKPYKSLRDRIFVLLLPPQRGARLRGGVLEGGTVEEKGENAHHAGPMGAVADNDLTERTRAKDEHEKTRASLPCLDPSRVGLVDNLPMPPARGEKK
jgi:hypothetical protein